MPFFVFSERERQERERKQKRKRMAPPKKRPNVRRDADWVSCTSFHIMALWVLCLQVTIVHSRVVYSQSSTSSFLFLSLSLYLFTSLFMHFSRCSNSCTVVKGHTIDLGIDLLINLLLTPERDDEKATARFGALVATALARIDKYLIPSPDANAKLADGV